MFHNFPDVGEPGLGGTHIRAIGRESPAPCGLPGSVPGSQAVTAGFGCHGGWGVLLVPAPATMPGAQQAPGKTCPTDE